MLLIVLTLRQHITDTAGRLVLEQPPTVWQLWLWLRLVLFKVDQGVVCQYVLLFHQSTQIFEHVGSEGRVEKSEIECLAALALQPGNGIGLDDAPTLGVEEANIVAQHGDGLRRLFDKDDTASAA